MIEKRIEALNAQIELATHNLQHFEKLIEDQQAVIAQLGEEQDDEEEACEDIEEQLEQMKRDQKEKEDWLRAFWRSNVLREAPFTRKNLQKRRNFGERQHEALFVLDTEKQEDMKQTLILKKARLEEIAEEYYEEDLNLQNLQESFFDYHSFQLMLLIAIRNNELFRRERMNND